MKILIMISQKRIEKYSPLDTLPEDWDLVYLDAGSGDDDILSAGKDADIIFADAISTVSGDVIRKMPNLKLIHSEGVGFNGIDIDAAAEKNVFVCNNAGANCKAVAEQAVLLMLSLLRRLSQGDDMVRKGFQIQAKEGFILDGLKELGDCRVGLVGFGAIARATARLLSAFGSELVCFSRSRPRDLEDYNTSFCSLDDLVRESDIVSLHVPVTPLTRHLVDGEFLGKMKSTALLINTARGEIVDQDALVRAITENTIAGAGLDTLDPEPVTLDNPLLQLPESARYRLVFSPHIGGTTDGMFTRAHSMVWQNIITVAQGDRPRNIVNGV